MTPTTYACDLLRELGHEKTALNVPQDTRDDAMLWASSGAQYLTGDPDGPSLPCPAPLATCAQGAWLALGALCKGAADPDFAAYQFLGERAAALGLERNGAISAGGACRLLDCADGQLALNLPRADDWELLPAWLECPVDSWDTVAEALRSRSCEPMVARARLLGLAAAASRRPQDMGDWFKAQRLAAPATEPREQPLVVDLTALWAGPLCAQLLSQMGARVIKVESLARPDGARSGPPLFFDLLNVHKQSVALDIASSDGRRQLRQLLLHADIVLESSRPRALEQMGIHAADIVREATGQIWLSITGYGREAPMRDWIAYGDDAGVAAGLSWLLREAHGNSVFCGDAIADPLTGLHAALLAASAWQRGGGVLLDVSLTGVLAHCIAAGGAPRVSAQEAYAVLPPRARATAGAAAPFGSYTAQVLAEFDIL